MQGYRTHQGNTLSAHVAVTGDWQPRRQHAGGLPGRYTWVQKGGNVLHHHENNHDACTDVAEHNLGDSNINTPLTHTHNFIWENL